MADRLSETVEKQSNMELPRYEQVKRAVRRYIETQGLKPGAKLPPEVALCKEFNLSRVTVNKALKDLEWEGVVKRVRGSGTYVQKVGLSNRILVTSLPLTNDDFNGPVFAGIRDEASAQKVDIAYDTQAAVPKSDVVHRLGVDGVLSISAYGIDDLTAMARLHEAGVKIVGLMQRSRVEEVPLVSASNFEGMQEVVRHLAGYGHRRIACVMNNAYGNDVMERFIGLQCAMAEANIPLDPDYLLYSGGVMNDSRLGVWWRRLTVPPTALILDGYLALPMFKVLNECGVCVPADLSVVAIDDRRSLAHLTPAITALAQPTYEMGRAGMRKLVNLLRGEESVSQEVLPTKLIIRDSVTTPRK